MHAVEQAVSRCKLNGGVLVAVSGGPDSVAMLAALHSSGVSPLAVGHVNHGLRGAEGDGDAVFVQQLAERLELPCVIENVDVSAASGGRNIESVARQLRYDALARIATALTLSTIATGHTLNDQAETVLMRLLRGSGLAGLAGIRPIGRWNGVRVVRPLLKVQRTDILDYLKSSCLPFRVDATNQEMRFARNQLRLELWPMLQQFAPANAEARLAALADEARRYARELRQRARNEVTGAELPRAGEWCVFDARKLSQISRDELCELWRFVWKRERWPTVAMNRNLWHRVAGVCDNKPSAVDCPGGIRVRRVGRVVRAGPGA